jgi:hypothetical protein
MQFRVTLSQQEFMNKLQSLHKVKQSDTTMDRHCGPVSEFLATDPEDRVRFPALPEKKVVGLERGPLSLVSTTEELLDREVAAPV